MTPDLRDRLEQHAVAVCLAFSGLCFGIGLVLNHGAKAVDRALSWGAPR